MALIRVITVFSFLILSTFIFDASAQNKKLYKGQYHRGKNKNPNVTLKGISKNELITLFLTTGTATYYGDLSHGKQALIFRPQLGGGAILRTNYFGKRLNFRADVRIFRLYSDDYFEGRNLDFRSTNWEFIASGQLDLFGYEKMMRRRTFINPYFLLGIGAMTLDPWGSQSNGTWVQLSPLQTEHVDYSKVAFVFTGGFGLKFRYTYKWSFMLEGYYRFTTSDYIDDASSYDYPPKSSFSDPQAAWMSNKTGQDPPQGYRGTPKRNDGYMMLSVGVAYTFTKNHKPKFHNDKTLLRKN